MTDPKDIPSAPYYVLSDDVFMSGWGEAEGATNRCVVACSNLKVAERVARYAHGRKEQRNVRIVQTKPGRRRGYVYSLIQEWIEVSHKGIREREEDTDTITIDGIEFTLYP